MWGRFARVSEYVKLGELPEAKELFAELEPVEL